LIPLFSTKVPLQVYVGEAFGAMLQHAWFD
jgi:hypothetical protein